MRTRVSLRTGMCAAILMAACVCACMRGALASANYKHGEFDDCGGGAEGVCIDTDAYECSVATLTNKCAGGNSIRCCPSSGGFTKKGGDSCASTHASARCKRTPDCSSATGSTVHTGLCAGPTGITCCAPNPSKDSTGGKDQDSHGSGAYFLPPAPDTSASLGTCSTPEDGLKGECIDVGKCTGGTFIHRCPGSSAIVCCVPETRKTPVQNHPKMSLSTFRILFEGISATRAAALYPYFLSALVDAKIDSCHEIAAFIGQISHESAGLYYFEELASGSAYNGRSDLGNNQPGDGPRYKGRGPIQLTGRANYRRAGRDIGMDFEANPEQVCLPSAGFKAATWYWNSHGLNRYATGSYNDFVTLTRRVNGGTNGLTDRVNRWTSAKKLLGCSSSQNFLTDPSDAADSNKDSDDNFWRDNGSYVYASAGAAGLVAIVAVLYLRKQRQRRDYGAPLEDDNGDAMEAEAEATAGIDQVEVEVKDPATALVVQQNI